jgi:predicted transposase YdaD
LDTEFWQELKEFEQERNMTYVTTGERIGYERGIEEGEQKGEQKGEQRLILKQLQRRFGELPSEAIASIQSLDVIQLEELAEALLDFTEIDDLVRWFTV